MSLKLLAGVRPQSKVECSLGSGPKVKSQATVLWRQTRGLRFGARPEGCALSDERKLLKMGGWLRMGRGWPPTLFFVGKRKKLGLLC